MHSFTLTANVDNDFQTWVDQVGALNATAPPWHCEACPDTLPAKTGKTGFLLSVLQ